MKRRNLRLLIMLGVLVLAVALYVALVLVGRGEEEAEEAELIRLFEVDNTTVIGLGWDYNGQQIELAKNGEGIWQWTGDEACTLEVLGGDKVISSFDGFYDRSYLEKKDKYAAFLSSNNGHVRIRDTQNADKPTMLLIKDSFAHSVVPFLAQHYNLEILDLRYYRSTTAAFLAENEVDSVLILCGLDSMATSNLLESLPIGME